MTKNCKRIKDGTLVSFFSRNWQSKYRLYLLWMVVSLIGFFVVCFNLVLLAASSTEEVRVRNALVARLGTVSDFNWSPNEVPVDFIYEQKDAYPIFRDAIKRMGITEKNEWNGALVIAKHLQQKIFDQKPIRSDLLTTYRKIVDEGEGYCADFSNVFMALSLAAGIPVRMWGISFDGFGGNGHVFNEVFDKRLNKWIMIDVYYNIYAIDIINREPLSVIELRERLNSDEARVLLCPVGPARSMFKSDIAAIEYYREGMKELSLWFGNNVFTYDSNKIIRFVGFVSRPLERFAGIAIGLYPQLTILEQKNNPATIDKLFRLRLKVMILLSSAVVLFLSTSVLTYVVVINKRSGRTEDSVEKELS